MNIAAISEKENFILSKSEPEWLREFRKQLWSKFKSLPFESDPNMLNFVQPKTLGSLQLTIPTGSIDTQIDSQTIAKDEKTGINLSISPMKIKKVIAAEGSEKLNKDITFLPILQSFESQNNIKMVMTSMVQDLITDKLMALILSTFTWGS
jgi:hypothetical protein